MRQILLSLAWLAAVVLIAFGAAGIVAGMDASATAGLHPWQTARDDVPANARLDAVAADLGAVSDQLDDLSTLARGALSALTANDPTTATAALAAGDVIVADIQRRSATVAVALADVPLIGTPAGAYRLGPAVRERHARLTAALAETRGLDGVWASLAGGSVAVTRLSTLLAAHDEAVLAAAKQGRGGEYAAALGILDDADAAIADGRRLRDQLARSIDVTTLDEWLDRSARYDVALRALYAALDESGGRVTTAVRRAATEERKAKDGLPPDTRGLVLIMAEIGRGGMNGAIIGIEQVRGELADALVESAASPGS